MYTTVTVLKINNDKTVTVSCSSASCSSCKASAFCSSKNTEQYTVLNPKEIPVMEGDRVTIFLSPRKTVFSTALVFALPLAVFPAGYSISTYCFKSSEITGALGGFAAMALTFLLSGFFVSRRKKSLMPVITDLDS